MITFETPEDKNCFIDPNEVAGIAPYAWAIFWGSKILLKGGESVVVCGEPEEVMRKLGEGLKQIGWYKSESNRFCSLDYIYKQNYSIPVYIKEK